MILHQLSYIWRLIFLCFLGTKGRIDNNNNCPVSYPDTLIHGGGSEHTLPITGRYFFLKQYCTCILYISYIFYTWKNYKKVVCWHFPLISCLGFLWTVYNGVFNFNHWRTKQTYLYCTHKIWINVNVHLNAVANLNVSIFYWMLGKAHRTD